jgi:hypothetical protein
MKPQNPLMKIQLFRHLTQDPNVDFVSRGIDARWTYDGFIEKRANLSGFNPFSNTVFYPRNSHLDLWLKSKDRYVRKYNFRDRLLEEFFTALHDYLHTWAYQWIASLCPELRFGKDRVNEKNLENFSFCHLVSEAVATVGLDYWYLCANDIPQLLDVGTNFDTLTVFYHVKDDREFRIFNPKFNSQTKKFFKELVRFYCDGNFYGFDLNSVIQSPKTFHWLQHEIVYGQSQRIYSREWMIALSDQGWSPDKRKLASNYSFKEKWKINLVDQLSELLWEKVILDKTHFAPKKIHYPYPNKPRFLNPKMMNLNKISLQGCEDFEFHYYQQLARCDFDGMDKKEKSFLPLLKNSNDIDLCISYLSGFKKLNPAPKEPPYLFMLP